MELFAPPPWNETHLSLSVTNNSSTGPQSQLTMTDWNETVILWTMILTGQVEWLKIATLSWSQAREAHKSQRRSSRQPPLSLWWIKASLRGQATLPQNPTCAAGGNMEYLMPNDYCLTRFMASMDGWGSAEMMIRVMVAAWWMCLS